MADANTNIPTAPQWYPGCPGDRSVTGFRYRWGSSRGPMSKAKYYKRQRLGLGPREVQLPPGRVIITPDAEADWAKARSNPNTTEERLVAKLKAQRLAKTKKAAAKSVEGDSHVSKQRRAAATA